MNKAILLTTLISSLSIRADTPATPAVAAEVPNPPDVAPIVNQAVSTGMQVAQQALGQAQRAVQLAHANVAIEAGDGEGGELQTFFDVIGVNGRGATPSVVVRSSPTEAGTVSRTQEDLSVMQRILTKALEREVGREGRDAAMGIVLSALPGSRNPQTLYLEGYGALFFLNVKFPLVAPPTKTEEKAERPTDTTWEETKRELYGARSPKVHIFSAPGSDNPPEYNAEQVDGLKKELLEALKNATNIRDVKPDESITVVVVGGRTAGTLRVKRAVKNLSNNMRRADTFALADDSRPSGRESTLTIRVKKADVDAFAQGNMDFEQFQKRAAVATY
jgi:hypothetical protein